MVRYWRQAWGTFLVLLAVACTGAASDPRSGISPGYRARDFTLEALDGSKISLSDYDGQVVLVNFWATWCPPCMTEIPTLEAVYRAHKDEGFVVLGINEKEPRSAVEQFVAEMDVTFPVLLDQEGKVANEYRLLGLPMSLLVDRDGLISVRHMGYLSEDKLAEYLNQLSP